MNSLDCMLAAWQRLYPLSMDIDAQEDIYRRGNGSFAVSIAMETASPDSGYFGDRIHA
jgi:hypothetical protein